MNRRGLLKGLATVPIASTIAPVESLEGLSVESSATQLIFRKGPYTVTLLRKALGGLAPERILMHVRDAFSLMETGTTPAMDRVAKLFIELRAK